MKYSFLSVILILGLSACSPIPVKVVPGTTNYSYNTGLQKKPTGKAIALIAPNMASALNKAQRSSAREFDTAFKSTIKEIISKKGFSLTGPYDSASDMVYSDKKNSYILAKIISNVSVGEKSTPDYNCALKHCTTTGYFYPQGTVSIQFIEPLTGQKIANKHIALDDLKQKFEYTKEYNNPNAQNDLILSGINMLDKRKRKTELLNNRPKALADAWTAIYQSIIPKLDQKLSRDEILSYSKDINELKSLKRF